MFAHALGARVEQLLLVEFDQPRLAEDSVDASSFHGVVVSLAKDCSVGFGALKKPFKSLSVTRSAIAFSLEQPTTSRLSKAASE